VYFLYLRFIMASYYLHIMKVSSINMKFFNNFCKNMKL
jgi:hypothetical protein